MSSTPHINSAIPPSGNVFTAAAAIAGKAADTFPYSYTFILYACASDSKIFGGRSKEFVGHSKTFVGHSKEFVGHSKTFVGHSKEFVGHSKEFVGRSKTFVGHSKGFGAYHYQKIFIS
jgi:hypothetical protein